MADRYDRSGNNEGGGGSFVMGMLAGAALGAGLAMLFAPKSGADLRNQIADEAGALANQAQEGYRKVSATAAQWADKGRDAAGEWAERGQETYGKAREAVARGADEAQQYARDAAATVTGVAGAGSRHG